MTDGIGPGWLLPQVPERTVFRDHGDARLIRTEWPRGRGYGHLIGTAFSVVILTILWIGLTPDARGFWGTVLLLGALAAIATIAYSDLACLLNWTDIRIGPDMITVRIAPVSWRGSKTIPAAELRQLYVEKDVGLFNDEDKFCRPEYRVMAMTDRQPDTKVIGGLPTKEQGWFIERQVEDFYGIDDRPMPTEIPKRRR